MVILTILSGYWLTIFPFDELTFTGESGNLKWLFDNNFPYDSKTEMNLIELKLIKK